MPSAEQGGVPQPENPHKPEEHIVYVRTAHFIDGLAAQQAYLALQRSIGIAQEQGEGWGLAGYHLTNQEDVSWYVVVAGKQPPETVAEQLSTTLAAGVPATLPEALQDLLTRHHRDTPESAMSVDEWLAADEQADAV